MHLSYNKRKNIRNYFLQPHRVLYMKHTFFFLQVLHAVELALLEILALFSIVLGHSQVLCPLQHCVQAGLFSSHLTYDEYF